MNPMYSPQSPDPRRATGPTYHACDINGMSVPNPQKNASTAGIPLGSSFAESHVAIG